MANFNKFSGSSTELTGNALVADVLEGKTFYSKNDELKLTGTMKKMSKPSYEVEPNIGHASVNRGNDWIGMTIPETGKYYENSYLWRYAKDLEIGDAQTSDVLSGKSFSSKNGVNIQGTMPDKNAEYYQTTEKSGLGAKGWIGLNIPETGKYTKGTYLYEYASKLNLGDATASDVLNGKTFTSQTSGVKISGTLNILEALGFTNVPSGEWVIKTGNLPPHEANANDIYIPLEVYIEFVQLASTEYHELKYGDTVLNSGREYSNGSAKCFCGVDLTKKQLSQKGCQIIRVTTWLEKVGGVTRQLLNLINHLVFNRNEVITYA